MFFANDFHPDPDPGSIMLGLTDQDVEGEWKTFEGEPAPYTNWNTGEPNGGINNNFAWVYTAKGERDHGPDYPAGTWNDIDGIFVNFICSYEPSVPRKLF